MQKCVVGGCGDGLLVCKQVAGIKEGGTGVKDFQRGSEGLLNEKREGLAARGSVFVQRQYSLSQGVAGGFGPVGGADLLVDVGHVASVEERKAGRSPAWVPSNFAVPSGIAERA